MEGAEEMGGFDAAAKKLNIPHDMNHSDNSLDGSRILIYFCGEAFCLLCAALYYKFLSPRKTTPTVRHAVSLVLGLAVGAFSFGMQFSHVILQSTVCYFLMLTLPANIMHLAVFAVSMGYLVILHLYRAFVIPEDVLYSIDVSGPLMIVTQKISSLAFSIHDGRHGNKDELSDLQKRYMISHAPGFLEYFSYIFFFQGVVAGPLCFYSDYIMFIDGTYLVKKDDGTGVQHNNNKRSPDIPSPFEAVMKKLVVTAFWMGFHFTMKPLYPEILNSDLEFIRSHSFLYRLYYMMVSMLCCRAKYYVAFTLGDAICNASGLGFNGYDRDGKPRWDLITNVKILGIETAKSFKEYLDNWNIQTAYWLRHVCYDRFPVQKRLATFLLSALWHGCYPGYYFTFITGTVCSEVGRKIRRKVRPHFLSASWLKVVYDVLTWFGTHLSMSYLVVPFTILHTGPTIVFFQHMYWFLHVILLALNFILPHIPSAVSSTEQRSIPDKTADGVKSGMNGVLTSSLHGRAAEQNTSMADVNINSHVAM